MWLGIDTSGAVSVALADEPGDGAGTPLTVRAVVSDVRARHHDEVLMGLVEEALTSAGARRADLTAVVAGRGPGPFTGLRVGLVTARTLAAVLDLPLLGLCSLDALALEAAIGTVEPLVEGSGANAGVGDAPARRTVGVALDARRREVYHARYEAAPGSLVRVDGPAVGAPADVAEALRACDVLVGTGCDLYPELLPAAGEARHVDAGFLLRAAALARAAGQDLSSTDPLYLREPDAAKPTARKSALGR